MTTYQIDEAQIASYLERRAGGPIKGLTIRPLGGSESGAAALKAFGYGRPLHLTYQVNGLRQQSVLRCVTRNGFGRERASDRIAEVWRDFHTFNLLPRHVRALDLIATDRRGALNSISQATELLLLTDYVPGQPYADDLLRIRDEGACHEEDESRAVALAEYLAEIHAVSHNDPLLWRRRLRDLVGHGEGIMGLADSYPRSSAVVGNLELREIEEAANRWRWRLKPMTHRLRQVHGDFHPFNILFAENTNFALIDRSRGVWGEPADDVSCLSINYLFFAVQNEKKMTGSLAFLYNTFWETYLDRSQDLELPQVIAPWFAWRALVLASPQWYPTLTEQARRRLLNFARNVMADDCFDWRNANRYLEASQ